MRILFVSHTSLVSGAERSLLDRMALLQDDAELILACPNGELERRARALGVEVTQLSVPPVSFSSGTRALVGAAIGSVSAGLRVRRVARRRDVDFIHAASPRAALVTAWCVFSRAGRLVDVRDVLPRSVRGELVRYVVRLTADVVVFNSRFTREGFGSTRPARAEVAYPPVNIERLLGLGLPASERGEHRSPSLGVIGQITPWKGQDDAIRTLVDVRRRLPEVTLRIVGSVVFQGDQVGFDNEEFRRGLRRLATELDVSEAVEFVEETDDIGNVLSSLDLLLVPSWEEPFGRVVVEGMAAGVPVIATDRGGPGELIQDGVTGFLAPPHAIEVWSALAWELLSDMVLRRRVALAARAYISTLMSRATRRDEALSLYRQPVSRVKGTPEPLPRTTAVSPPVAEEKPRS